MHLLCWETGVRWGAVRSSAQGAPPTDAGTVWNLGPVPGARARTGRNPCSKPDPGQLSLIDDPLRTAPLTGRHLWGFLSPSLCFLIFEDLHTLSYKPLHPWRSAVFHAPRVSDGCCLPLSPSAASSPGRLPAFLVLESAGVTGRCPLPVLFLSHAVALRPLGSTSA